MKFAPLLLLALPLAACASGPRPAHPAARIPLPQRTFGTVGLERVMGQDARALTALFGKPDADLIEGPGRKMQFGSSICVLDAYLYPPASGKGEATVTYLDARQRDGSMIDRASCVAALTRRDGGR